MVNSKGYGMKQLYPNFKVLSKHMPGGTDEYHNNMHNSGCLSWYSNRAPSEYKLEALPLQLTCSFPSSYISRLQKYSTLKNTKYIPYTLVWHVVVISIYTISCLSCIQNIFIHHSYMVIYQNKIAFSDLVLLQCSDDSPLALDTMQECDVTLTSWCQNPEYYHLVSAYHENLCYNVVWPLVHH
jgi:hypothetical protein